MCTILEFVLRSKENVCLVLVSSLRYKEAFLCLYQISHFSISYQQVLGELSKDVQGCCTWHLLWVRVSAAGFGHRAKEEHGALSLF